MSADISTLISNLKSLRSRYPAIHRQLNQKIVSNVLDGLYRCDDERYAYLVKDEKGHSILIKESFRQVDFGDKRIVVLLGVGLGYQLFDIFDRLDDDQLLIAVETRPDLLCKSLYVHDWQPLLRSEQFRLFLGSDRAGLDELAKTVAPAPTRESIKVLDNKVLVTIDQKPYAWWNIYFFLIPGLPLEGIQAINAITGGFNLWDPDSLYLNLPSTLLGRSVGDLTPEEIYGRFKILARALVPGLKVFGNGGPQQIKSSEPAGSKDRVSVVLLCWNKQDYTRRCLDSLLGRTDYPDMQVIAVDNGSSDATPQMLTEIAARDSRLVPVLLDKNHGIPGGRQKGLEAANGEYVLFLDNDTEIEREDFLQVMVRAMQSHPNVGSTGAFLNTYISDNDDSLIQCVHVPGMAVPVAWCSGYCLMVRRSALDEIGGIDAGEFASYGSEDVYLGYKLREHGWITVSTSDLVGVSHHIIHGHNHYDYDWKKTGSKNSEFFHKKFGPRRRLTDPARSNATACGVWDSRRQEFVEPSPAPAAGAEKVLIASNKA
jgi:GT2 family glycosyltransferase